MDRRIVVALVAVLSSTAVACGSGGSAAETPTGPTAAAGIRDDAALFRLVSQTDPFSRYTVFPNAEEFTTGRLDGSEAHRPVIRVSLNGTATAALQGGRLPPNGRFPDGSIVFKEIRPSAAAATSLYVVMVKDSANTLAGNGWLWAEYTPSGSTVFSVNSRGSACTSCHLRERGALNDLVRTFERQQ
jgi:hypothetical protein